MIQAFGPSSSLSSWSSSSFPERPRHRHSTLLWSVAEEHPTTNPALRQHAPPSSDSDSSSSLYAGRRHCRLQDDKEEEDNGDARRRSLLLLQGGGGSVLATLILSASVTTTPAVALVGTATAAAAAAVAVTAAIEEEEEVETNGAAVADASARTTAAAQQREQGQRLAAALLHDIPTYTIVDTAGVPYMVVGEDAKVTAYFFTTYDEAARILQLASASADKDDDVDDESLFPPELRIKRKSATGSSSTTTTTRNNNNNNPWLAARISTVSLDVAVRLTQTSRDGKMRCYFQVAASVTAIDDALAITGADDLAETKIPLFYYVSNKSGDAAATDNDDVPLLLYLERSHMPTARAREKAQVTELFAILQALMTAADNNNNAALSNLRIVLPPDSARRVKECIRKGGSAPPLVLGQRNIVL